MMATLAALFSSTYPFSADKERGSGCVLGGGGGGLVFIKEVGGKSC